MRMMADMARRKSSSHTAVDDFGHPADKRKNVRTAELVDAADSKSVVRKDVGVRVSLGAPNIVVDCGILPHSDLYLW